MYTSTVEKISKFGIDYIVTMIFKDGVLVGNPLYQKISEVNLQKEIEANELLNKLSSQKLAILKNINQ